MEKTIELKNVHYEVVSNNNVHCNTKSTVLIKGVSVKFSSNKISAIIGPSGGGKTSLLDIITGHIEEGGITSGEVIYNGESRNNKSWLSEISYIGHKTVIPANQTVEEHINFSLQMSNNKSPTNITKIMEELDLIAVKDRKLLDLSNGELSRATIAAEIVRDTNIFIFDEPTKGIDSHTALSVIAILKKIAHEKNKIVIVSAHQPGDCMLEMFDTFVLIAQGTIIYSGSPKTCIEYFKSKGIEKPNGFSKGEFMLEITANKLIHPEIQKYQQKITEIMINAEMKDMEAREFGYERRTNDIIIDMNLNMKKSILLFKREMRETWRSMAFIKSLVVDAIIYTLFITGFVYLASQDIGNKIGIKKESKIEVVRSFQSRLKNYFSDDYNFFNEFFLYIKYSIFIYPIVNLGPSILDNSLLLSYEISKGGYNIIQLYLADILFSAYINLIRILIIFLLFFILGLKSGITIPVVITYVLGSFIVVPFRLLMRSVDNRLLIKVVLSFVSTVVPFYSPDVQTNTYEYLEESEDAKPLLKLRWVAFLWSNVFFQGYMNVRFIRRVFHKSAKKPLINAVSLFWQIKSSSVTKDQLLNEQKYFFLLRDYPDYYLIIATIFFTLITIIFNIYILVEEYSPYIRLRLSQQRQRNID